ncbi:P-loop containing nucleoside triphosphate hydrolase protein [Cyathus striatus]|nr:P-loop containing nucleoside triphosphate hydrolase protein [Cyathus striatus]
MAAVEHIVSHILYHFSTSQKPFFVALQGPQGSGKSYLSARVQEHLSNAPHSLRVAVLSIDDLYLSHESLKSLALNNPTNPLWRGRGQPGTHDIDLGITILTSLKQGQADVELPRFDKSLFDGEGDRLPMDGTGTVIKQPPTVDVVIMEGWFVGFHPIPATELDERWNGIWKEEREILSLTEDIVGHKEDILAVNDKLKGYVQLWQFFDVLIQLQPLQLTESTAVATSRYSVVYKWRLEQEHAMKAKNGGKGMPDSAVRLFVDRYIPGYVFFGDTSSAVTKSGGISRWMDKSLIITIDEGRNVVRCSRF